MFRIPLLAGLVVFATEALCLDAERLLNRAQRYFEPLPAAMPGAENDTAEKVALGRKLFFDKRLSINDAQSCATCHVIEDGRAGVDNLPTSPGARGEQGRRNTPTVLNAGWNEGQFWDGRAEDLTDQAKQPILNPIEMGMPDENFVVEKLRGIDEYVRDFAAAFPEAEPSLTYHNMAEAIAAFERTLRTEDRFDDFLNGDTQALNTAELRGLRAFMKLDCTSCHDGPLLGGTTFETLGKEKPYDNQSDLGVFELTGDEDDKMVFKVSGLRNVALTAPYFHDGRMKTLEDAVRTMATIQVDRNFTDEQIDDIVAFLKTLSDKARVKE
jgi:cytochrome c peroxidase